MKKALMLVLLALFCVSTVTLADSRVRFTSELMFRYERQDFPDAREDVKRYRLRWRPGLVVDVHPTFQIGAEVEGNWIDESDEDEPFPQFHTPTFDRDNFKRDDVVLSKAFLRFTPNRNIDLVGGKFENPFLTTEMVWDRDLRPNGFAFSASYFSPEESVTLKATAGDFYSTHYVSDRTNVVAAQAMLQATGSVARFTLAGSYYNYNVDDLDPTLFRTNTQFDGRLLNDYDLIDLIARLRLGTTVPVTFQIDFVKNIAADTFLTGIGNGDQGYMADVFVGQLQSAHQFRVGVNYHRVESDAVLAAYNLDDWWFPTRGEGWRFHAGYMILDSLSVQASYLRQTLIGQDDLFKRWMFTAEFNWR